MRKKLIIADDHPLLLQGIEHFLKSKGFIVLETATDGNAAYNAVVKNVPDIAILDFDMPILNGLEVARLCLQNELPVKVIILTLHKEEALINELGKSIHGYLLKDDALHEVESCIEKVLGGKSYLSKNLNEDIYLPGSSSELSLLTPTEIKILRYLAKDWSSFKIAEQLFISKRTVEKHRSNIIQKLGLKSSQNALLLWVRKHPELFGG